MKFAREDYSADLIAEMVPLWRTHYDEISAFKDIPLDPDLETYEKLAQNGILRIYTARLDGVLVGYQVLIVAKNPHYRGCMQAVQDILYLVPKVRQGMTGQNFISWVDQELQQENINLVFHHIKVAHDYTPILKRLGYKPHEKIWVRRLN